jgi:hypothetical protein
MGINRNFPAENGGEHADAAGIVYALQDGKLLSEGPSHLWSGRQAVARTIRRDNA